MDAIQTRARIVAAFSDAGEVLDAARAVVEYAQSMGNTSMGEWFRDVDAVGVAGASGTVKSWASAHHGSQIATLQVTDTGSAWVPRVRTLDASRATFVTLDGSRRDYAGTRVVAATPEVIAFVDGATLVIWSVR